MGAKLFLMRLITVCPACTTMFKVVTDQLKISEGWVRCGQCGHVFNATLHFTPEISELPVMASTGTTPSPEDAPFLASESEKLSSSPVSDGWNIEAVTEMPRVIVQPEQITAETKKIQDETSTSIFFNQSSAITGNVDSQTFDFDPEAWRIARESLKRSGTAFSFPEASKKVSKTAVSAPAIPVSEVGKDAPVNQTEIILDAAPSLSSESSSTVPAPELSDTDDSLMDAPPEPDVTFVREAKRKAFWQKTSIRILLSAFCMLLSIILVLQVALHHRNMLAALDSRLEPLLANLCLHLKCQLKPPRDIESIIVESASLTKTDIAGQAFRLTFVLKNKSAVALEAPMLELTLTNAEEKAFARRILTPAQYGADTLLLTAQSDFAGTVNFTMALNAQSSTTQNSAAKNVLPATTQLTGYLVVAFYP